MAKKKIVTIEELGNVENRLEGVEHKIDMLADFATLKTEHDHIKKILREKLHVDV
jgi:hypothetical protein